MEELKGLKGDAYLTVGLERRVYYIGGHQLVYAGKDFLEKVQFTEVYGLVHFRDKYLQHGGGGRRFTQRRLSFSTRTGMPGCSVQPFSSSGSL